MAGTGVETDATVTLRFRLRKGHTVPSPQFSTSVVGTAAGPWFAATGHGPDLYEASREVLRGILDYLGEQHGLARLQACILASACVDLHISQVVNGGVFTVSAFLPLDIFRARGQSVERRSHAAPCRLLVQPVEKSALTTPTAADLGPDAKI